MSKSFYSVELLHIPGKNEVKDLLDVQVLCVYSSMCVCVY